MSEWAEVAVYLYVLLLRNLCRYHVILRRTYDERVCTSTRSGVRRLSAVNYIPLCGERRLYVSRIGTGAKVPGNESSWERKFQRAKVPCNFRSWERKFQGAKVPPMVLSLLGAKVRGNESSIIRRQIMRIVRACTMSLYCCCINPASVLASHSSKAQWCL